jgi:hypothetical protein
MAKLDLKQALKPYFHAPRGRFVELMVPEATFLKVDGSGDPNASADFRVALQWLYGLAYPIKFASKARLGRDYTIPPLQALWWSDDPGTFVRREKDRWNWTVMLMLPDFVPEALFQAAVERLQARRPDCPESLRREPFAEGRVLQGLHIGSYDDEGPMLAHLHDQVMPAAGLTFNGPHHEIYLGDPARSPPERLKTILRQAVRPL